MAEHLRRVDKRVNNLVTKHPEQDIFVQSDETTAQGQAYIVSVPIESNVGKVYQAWRLSETYQRFPLARRNRFTQTREILVTGEFSDGYEAIKAGQTVLNERRRKTNGEED